MAAGVATAERLEGAAFASAAELRDVLEALLREVESDEEVALRLRSAHVSYRYVFTDMGMTLDVFSSESRDGIEWSFSERPKRSAAVTLEMTSEVANRYLQGRENLAIGLARRRIHCSCDARAALKLLPVSQVLSRAYRRVLERDYPHLLLA